MLAGLGFTDVLSAPIAVTDGVCGNLFSDGTVKMCVSLDSFKKFIEAKKSEVTEQLNVTTEM